MLSASLLSIVQRCGEQKLPKRIKKQYGVAPEDVSKKCFCIVLILPTRCEPFQHLMADNGVDSSRSGRLWRSGSPALSNRHSKDAVEFGCHGVFSSDPAGARPAPLEGEAGRIATADKVCIPAGRGGF